MHDKRDSIHTESVVTTQMETRMITKIALIAVAAAMLFGTASATFAAPKHAVEPLYFHYATGEQG